jgi:myo-inositol-1(or 4)-monophosphatase
MTSHSLAEIWKPILLGVAEKVHQSIQNTMLNKPALEILELKKSLDNEAQQDIRDFLEQNAMPIHVISEEGDYSIGRGGHYLIVDPVDGTTNMAKGIPFAATSLALSKTQKQSGIIAGLIMNLFTGEYYRAERNNGAWLGVKRINSARSKPLAEAMISIDISKGKPIKSLEKLIQKAGHIRQLGSAALSLCYLASGIVDVHVDVRKLLRATDVSAGLLILKEAGGVYMIDGLLNGDLELARESTLNLVAASSPWTLDKIRQSIG